MFRVVCGLIHLIIATEFILMWHGWDHLVGWVASWTGRIRSVIGRGVLGHVIEVTTAPTPSVSSIDE